MWKRATYLLMITGLLSLLAAQPVAAQSEADQPTNCETYEGIVCFGWLSDNANVVSDDARIEQAIGAVVERYGHQIAVVTVGESPSGSPLDFANELANAWGVGDADRQDGVLVLIDIVNRRTEMTAGPGVPLLDYTRVTGAGNSFFGRDDFDSGIVAIVGSLEQELAFVATGAGPDLGGGSTSANPAVNLIPPADDNPPAGLVVGALAAAVLVGGGVGLAAARQRRRERIGKERVELIDGDVRKLEPGGHELPLLAEYSVEFRGNPTGSTTGTVLAALERVQSGIEPHDAGAMNAAWEHGLVAVVERDRLLAETEIPLELRVSSEQPLLEGALQAGIRDAIDIDPDRDDEFNIKRQDLQRVIASLRPHRIANTRFRLGQAISDRTVKTTIGYATVTDDGDRFLEVGPVLEANEPIATSVAELAVVYATATAKASKMENLYDQLPMTTTRPAVAAALADLSDDVETSYLRYEALRQTLEAKASMLSRDGLSIPAIAALLLMNNDAEDVAEFIDAYEANRGRGIEADTAVEYALAGLSHPGEISRIRAEADRLGLPIALTAALLQRRDDGPAIYRALADELAASGVKGDARRTIAAVLAISLEPAQAIRRWAEARRALAALGLVGAYADIAAAFGASDPRGARTFALAYAAQRQALSRSTIDDADRFAPELAHEGTGRQTDSWNGSPIPRGLRSFDPYTLLFYHWVITKGSRGSYGWEPIYRDTSWSSDAQSWWGGGGGFGGSGSGSGGSSWGGGSWSSGSFGGFGGGGGFSGGGGSGW